MRLFLAAVFLVWLIPSGFACSIFIPPGADYTGVKTGWTYFDGKENPTPLNIPGVGPTAWAASEYEQLVDRAEVIMVARVEINPITGFPAHAAHKDARFGTASFIPVKVLRGQQESALPYVSQVGQLHAVLDLERSRGDWRKLQYGLEASIKYQIDRHMSDFWFWDQSLHEPPSVYAPYPITSCGPEQLVTFDEQFEYLVILGNEFGSPVVSVVEPVSGLDDPLVKRTIERLEGPENRVSGHIPAKQFLANFDGAAVIEIETCKTWVKRSGSDNYYDLGERYELDRDEPDVALKIVDSTPGFDEHWLAKYSVEDWADLFDYFGLSKEKVSCKRGQQFLTLPRPIDYQPYVLGLLTNTKSPIVQMRYARIENGDVLVSDLMTNYALEGPATLSVSEVMALFD